VVVAALVLLVSVCGPATAQPPPGYYDSVNTTNQDTLRDTLHEVIDDHTRYGYDTGSPNSWDILEEAEADPDAPLDYVLDIYKNDRLPLVDADRTYQREHTWPKSYGFPISKQDADGVELPWGVHNYPYTDCHALFLAYGNYNGSRNNRPYAACMPCEGDDCYAEPLQTEENYDRGGDTGMVHPGWANWRTLSPDGRFIWETWMGRRGDVARAQFYMDVRYEGDVNAAGEKEPDLQLIDELEVIKASSDSDANHTEGFMGLLSDLLVWHFLDPPDTIESGRHEVVYGYQGNRNPFVDNPGWAYCLHLNTCSADLWLTKSDGMAEVIPGETLTYRIEVGGDDPMMGAVVRDAFDPTRFDLAGVTWTCAPTAGADPGTYCPASGTGSELEDGVAVILEAGDSVLFTVTATLQPGAAPGALVNTATVDPPAGLPDPAPGDNTGSDTDQILPDGACGAPETWDVSGREVDSARTFTACTALTAGDFGVMGSGDVTFRAGERIALADGFRVESGGSFRAVIDPSL
jgi:endonuclease I